MTKRGNGGIITKLTRESTAPNLENDTETTTQDRKTVIPNELTADRNESEDWKS